MNKTNKPLALLLGVAFLLSGNAAFAEGTGTSATSTVVAALTSQIQMLLAEVESLKKQISDGAAITVARITNTLKIGMKHEEVNILQSLLAKEDGVYPEGLITGYFGPKTEIAVRKFQEKYGLATVGIVGPATRAKLNLLAGAGASGIVPPGIAKSFSQKFADGEILLKFKPGLIASEQADLLGRWGLKEKEELPHIQVKILTVPEGAEEALAAALSHNPNVEFAEVNSIATPTYIPNDPYYTSSYSWHLPKIGAPSAWDSNKGAGVTIAILDGGVDCTQSDMSPNCVPGWNTASNNSDTSAVNPHGTAVGSTAAAVGDNGIMNVGVSYQSKIMPIRISNTSDGATTCGAIANGIIYASDHGARVASNSYYIFGCSTIVDAAKYMASKGGVYVRAMGNNGTTYSTILDDPSFIQVSATDANDTLTSWSNYGPQTDIAAPGLNIFCIYNGAPGSCWGTSFSVPIVSGTLALEFAVKPSLTSDQAISVLEQTATDLGAPGWDQYYGWGRVNAASAVASAASTTVQTDTQAPATSITSPTTGSTVSGTISVSASASDNVGVSKVELWKNDALSATDTASPYSFVWNTANNANGAITLQTKAYDAAGNIGTSSAITVTVNNVADTIAPTTVITSPANGSTMPSKGNMTISATASDNIAVTSIELYFDTKLYGTCSNVTSCSASVNVRKVSSGTHTVTSKAYDAAGNVGTASVSVVK